MGGSTVIKTGDRVIILAPPYASGMIGVVLQVEEHRDGTPSNRWLVQIEDEDMILSLPDYNLAQINE